MVKDADGLTIKQREFVNHYYSNRGNATQAYKDAGYSANSDSVAASEAFKLLKNPKIQAALKKLQQSVAEETLTDIVSIIKEAKLLAFSDIKNAIDVSSGGEITLKSLDEIPEDTSKAIQEISAQTTRNGSSLKIKMHDKMRSIELLAKINGLMDDLNIAMAIFKRYGFEIQQTAEGYAMIDSYKKSQN